MDRSLWLLLRLRAKGWVRRWTRNLRTLKGALLALVAALVLLPSILSAVLVPRIQIAGQLEWIRRFGPAGLLGYCILNVLLSTGERALVYSPAEVNSLFCGPFRPRQLLVYKIVGNLAAALFGAAFATLFVQHHTASPWAAFVGLFLALELLYLVSLAVSLCAGVVGAAAFNRQRKTLLVLVLGLVAFAIAMVGQNLGGNPAELIQRVGTSPVLRVLTAPFRPFVMTFTAERTWPDMVAQAALSAAIDLGLLGIVIGLNFEFLEVSARASARRYELLRRVRRGGVLADSRSARVRIPVLPWLGGAGPNLWRQLTTAARSVSRVGAVLVLFALPLATVFVLSAGGQEADLGLAYPPLVVWASLAVFAPTMIGYDFRPDLSHMEELKTLPIRPTFLVVGQLATPVLVISAAEWTGLVLIGTQVDLPPVVLPAALFLAPPLNLLLVGLENLFFLWFPSRFVAGASADFQMMGRQFLMMMGRLVCGLFAAGLAAALGAAAFFAGGESWAAAVACGWFALTVTGFGLVVLIAQAFQSFDIARDRLE